MIHADLFPDNVFFLGDRLSGVIDFYFACNDFYAYDIAICLNAWCFEPDSFNATKARLHRRYRKVRPLPAAEIAAAAARPRQRAALPADAPLRLAEPPAGSLREAEGPDRVSAQAALPSAVSGPLAMGSIPRPWAWVWPLEQRAARHSFIRPPREDGDPGQWSRGLP